MGIINYLIKGQNLYICIKTIVISIVPQPVWSLLENAQMRNGALQFVRHITYGIEIKLCIISYTNESSVFICKSRTSILKPTSLL